MGRTTSKSRQAQLAVEQLEDRCTPAAHVTTTLADDALLPYVPYRPEPNPPTLVIAPSAGPRLAGLAYLTLDHAPQPEPIPIPPEIPKSAVKTDATPVLYGGATPTQDQSGSQPPRGRYSDPRDYPGYEGPPSNWRSVHTQQKHEFEERVKKIREVLSKIEKISESKKAAQQALDHLNEIVEVAGAKKGGRGVAAVQLTLEALSGAVEVASVLKRKELRSQLERELNELGEAAKQAKFDIIPNIKRVNALPNSYYEAGLFLVPEEDYKTRLKLWQEHLDFVTGLKKGFEFHVSGKEKVSEYCLLCPKDLSDIPSQNLYHSLLRRHINSLDGYINEITKKIEQLKSEQSKMK